MIVLGKLYNALYNGFASFDNWMRNIGKPKVDAVSFASPTASQALKNDSSIAYKASATKEGIPTIVSGFTPDLPTAAKPLSKKGSPYTSFGSTVASAPSAAALDYLNADLAKHYGMDQTTAYNEALSNTAYQRAVKDMQDAGLNPAVLFGNGRVSGADGVYGATPASAASVDASSGFSRSYGSKKSGKLFSSDTYGMISGAGALIGAVIGAKTGYAGLGALAGSNIATSAAKVLNGVYKKFK